MDAEGYKEILHFTNIQSFVEDNMKRKPCPNEKEVARHILYELGYHMSIVKSMSNETLTEALTYQSVDVEEIYLPVKEGVIRLLKRVIKTTESDSLLVSIESQWMTAPVVENIGQLNAVSNEPIATDYNYIGFIYYEGSCAGEAILPDFCHKTEWNRCIKATPLIDVSKNTIALPMNLTDRGKCQYYTAPAIAKGIFLNHTVDWKQIIGYIQFKVNSSVEEIQIEIL